MKKQLLSLLSAFVMTSAVSQIPSNGKILHLDFDWNSTYGSFYDASGVNNTMPLNTGSVGQAAGYNGQPSTAVYFNGLSYVNYASGLNNIPEGNSPYTIALMVKVLNGNVQNAGFMGYGSASTGNCNSLRLSGNAMVMNYWYGGANYDFNATASSQILGVWTHIAVTYDGTTRKMYVNGTLIGSMTTVSAPTYSNSSFYIGRTIDPAENLVGTMDEFIMYNRALSATEVAQLSAHAFCLTSMTVTPSFGPALNISLNGFTNPTTVTATSASTTNIYTVTTGTTLTIPNLNAATEYTINAQSASGGCFSEKKVTTTIGCSDYAPSNGLVLHLPFNGNVTDVSATGAVPSVNTGTLANDKCGNSNSAYSLAAGNYLKYDLTQYPSLKAGENGKATIVCWAKPTNNAAMANYASMIEIGESVFLRKSNSGAYFEGGGYNANTISGSGGYFGMTPNWSAFDDWRMYTFTYDATATSSNAKTSVWLDTLEYTESNPNKLSDFYNKPITYSVSTTNTSLWIGGGSVGVKKFNGLIDNVCIYNRVLTKSELKDIYIGNVPSVTTNINELKTKTGLILFPNPFQNTLNIKSENDIFKSEIFDLTGSCIMIYSDVKNNELQINLAELNSGIYIIKVSYKDGTVVSQKIVKE